MVWGYFIPNIRMNMKKAINFCAFPMSRFQKEKHIYLFPFSFTPLLNICVELSAVYGTKHGRRNVNNLYLRKCDLNGVWRSLKSVSSY